MYETNFNLPVTDFFFVNLFVSICVAVGGTVVLIDFNVRTIILFSKYRCAGDHVNVIQC